MSIRLSGQTSLVRTRPEFFFLLKGQRGRVPLRFAAHTAKKKKFPYTPRFLQVLDCLRQVTSNQTVYYPPHKSESSDHYPIYGANRRNKAYAGGT